MADFEAAIQAGQNLAQPSRVDEDGIPFIALGRRVVSLEGLMGSPQRFRGVYRLSTLEALRDFLTKYKTPDTIVFYRRGTRGDFFVQAIIDFHGDTPGWCMFRAIATIRCEEAELRALDANVFDGNPVKETQWRMDHD